MTKRGPALDDRARALPSRSARPGLSRRQEPPRPRLLPLVRAPVERLRVGARLLAEERPPVAGRLRAAGRLGAERAAGRDGADEARCLGCAVAREGAERVVGVLMVGVRADDAPLREGRRAEGVLLGDTVRLDGVPRVAGAIRLDGLPRVAGAARLDGVPRVAGAIRLDGVPRVAGAARLDGVPRVAGATRLDGVPRVAGVDRVAGAARPEGLATLDDPRAEGAEPRTARSEGRLGLRTVP